MKTKEKNNNNNSDGDDQRNWSRLAFSMCSLYIQLGNRVQATGGQKGKACLYAKLSTG